MRATELETQKPITIIGKSDDKTIAERWKQHNVHQWKDGYMHIPPYICGICIPWNIQPH